MNRLQHEKKNEKMGERIFLLIHSLNDKEVQKFFEYSNLRSSSSREGKKYVQLFEVILSSKSFERRKYLKLFKNSHGAF